MEQDPESTWELPLDGGAELDLELDAGPISIEPVADGEAPRIVAAGRWPKPPIVVLERTGRVVRVRVDHGDRSILGFWPWGGRAARLIVRVPADVRGRVRTGAGNVRVRDLEGCDLALETSAGTVHARHVRGTLRLATAAGTIDGDDLEGSIDAQTAAGTIDLAIRALDPGVHRVHTDAGTVRVDVPHDLPVQIRAHSPFGGARIDVPSTRDAAATLDLSSGAGTIAVRASLARAPVAAPPNDGPYRRAGGVSERTRDAEVEQVLELVAQGKVTPSDASELLKALGHA